MATVFLETFGCQMNELDSELVRSHLRALGHSFVDDWQTAEVVLFNTCSVREHAEHKAYSRLGIIGQRKKRGEQVILGVLGCMAERDGPDMLRRYPQVDLLCGPGELDRLPLLIDNAFRSGQAPASERVALAGNRHRRSATLAAAEDSLELLDLARAFDPDAREGRAWSAYVRITRGCNKFCTYCVVPNTRGAEVHRPPDHIVEECRKLAEAGVVEITLLGQTVNHYRYTHGVSTDASGREAPQVGPGLSAFRGPEAERLAQSGGGERDAIDASGRRVTTFARLLARIHDEVPQLRRLRFVTSYPRDFGPDVLDVIAARPRIAPYIHAPAQSGSDRILKLMNRGYQVADYRAFVESIFERMPQATLAGDFIVGFPTETDEDFEASLALIRELPFKNNFIFKYSPRPGTVAIDRFADDVPVEIKKLRNNTMLEVQAETSRRVHAAWVGREVEILVERIGSRRGAAEGDSERGAVTPSAAEDAHPRESEAPRRVALAVIGAGSRGRGESERGGHGGYAGHGGFGGEGGQAGHAGKDSHASLRVAEGAPGSRPGANGDRSPRANEMIEIIGRTSGDLIVSCRQSASSVADLRPGAFVRVRLDSAEPLLLRGTVSGRA
ncbi:MAG: MiaB/RimO family radical SAM methylthiotransferase [Phycisphaeraceae bacterium]|nr:MiaB/RimO family radical SAM methylthiotransferase [Phycisphaeraceae bacterium]